MSYEVPNYLQAAASVAATASGAGVPVTFNGSAMGFTVASCTHTATGIYDLFLDEGLTVDEGSVVCSANSTTLGAKAQAAFVTDTHWRVTTEVSGAASDAIPFSILCFRRPTL